MTALNKKYFLTNIKHYIALFAHKVCKALGVEIYYESNSGIKVLNRKVERNISKYEIRNIDPNQVRLFADGLKDKYSLTGTFLSKSPHVDLMEKILKLQDISECDYVRREASGRLDGRFECLVNSRTISQHILKCNEVKNKLTDKLTDKPKLVEMRDNYYVLDGKHRMALAICKGITLDCVVYGSEHLQNSNYISNLLQRMERSKNHYTKNIELLRQI